MDLMERLELFSGMLNCTAPLYHWYFDEAGQLLSTDFSEDDEQNSVLRDLGIYDLLKQKITAEFRMPIYIGNGMGVHFLADFCYEDSKLHLACLFGPMFTGSDSAMQIRKKLESLSIPHTHLKKLDLLFKQAAIIPPPILRHDAIMLHYVLTGERISAMDISTATTEITRQPPKNSEQFFLEHRGVWSSEQELLRMVRTGNTDYRRAMEHAMTLSVGVRMKEGSDLRKMKNSLLVLVAIVSRAAIDGGLSPAVAYSLNDYYADRIELCNTMPSIRQLSTIILDDYINRVHNVRTLTGLSTAIMDTCDYISLNLTTPLDVRTLAKRAGYAEYYFSAKFKRETGMSLTDYVNEKRMQYASELLLDSDYSISDIQNLLCFSSRSRFYELFKAYSGLSPAQYRANKQQSRKKTSQPDS